MTLTTEQLQQIRARVKLGAALIETYDPSDIETKPAVRFVRRFTSTDIPALLDDLEKCRELLADVADDGPSGPRVREWIESHQDAYVFCFFCNHEGHEHHDNCPWAKARAYLDAVRGEGEAEAPDGN